MRGKIYFKHTKTCNFGTDGSVALSQRIRFLPTLYMIITGARASCVFENAMLFWATAGRLGAMERTLSEAGHLRYGRGHLCLDPVRRQMVCGAGERQRSPGTPSEEQEFSHNNMFMVTKLK